MHDDTRGQTLAEFALIVTIFIVMLMGIFDLGRAVFTYTSITNGAREGARLGIVNQGTAQIATRTVNAAAMGDRSPTAVTVALSRPTSATTANDCTPAAVGCNLSVTYTTTFRPATPLIGAIVNQLTLRAESVEPVEFVCGVAGAAITNAALCPKQP